MFFTGVQAAGVTAAVRSQNGGKPVHTQKVVNQYRAREEPLEIH